MPHHRTITVIFVLIALLLSADIFFDVQEGMPLQHIIIEIVAFLAAAIPSVFSLLGLIKEFQRKERILRQDMQKINMEKDSWRLQAQSYLKALGEAIDVQFEQWGFSSAEKEIGLLILKGLSHKEIANLRGTVEKTVRQQAGSLYAKAGLEGKSQLAAFFLDDLDLFKSKASI